MKKHYGQQNEDMSCQSNFDKGCQILIFLSYLITTVKNMNVPTSPSKPKSQFLFNKKGPPKDFIRNTLTSSDSYSNFFFIIG